MQLTHSDPTPLEKWSRALRRDEGGAELQNADRRPVGTVPELAQPQCNGSPKNVQIEDMDAAHFAIFGCMPDQSARLYWQQLGDRKTEFVSLINKFLDALDHDPSELWDRIGISRALDFSPEEWPGLGPLPFVVAACHFTTGRFPKVATVDELLRKFLGKSLRPYDAAALISNSVEAVPAQRDILLGHYMRSRQNQFQYWRGGGTVRTTFSNKEIFQALVQLRLARDMFRTNWGLQPYHAMYRLLALMR